MSVCQMQKHSFTHADHIHPFLAVVFAIIDPLNSERISERLDRLSESDAMIAKICRRLVGVPFKSIFTDYVRPTRSLSKRPETRPDI